MEGKCSGGIYIFQGYSLFLALLKALRLVEQGRVSLKAVLQESSKGKAGDGKGTKLS